MRMVGEKLFSQRELARMFGISERTLEGLRQRRSGPPWIKLGKVVRYDPAVVEQWLAERTIDPSGGGAC